MDVTIKDITIDRGKPVSSRCADEDTDSGRNTQVNWIRQQRFQRNANNAPNIESTVLCYSEQWLYGPNLWYLRNFPAFRWRVVVSISYL